MEVRRVLCRSALKNRHETLMSPISRAPHAMRYAACSSPAARHRIDKDFNAGVAHLGEIGGSGGRDARPLRKRSARLAMRTEAWGYMTDYIPFDWQDPFRLDDQKIGRAHV